METTLETAAVWKPKVNPWVIGLSVSLAAFMEVLDMSIANVALPYIAGGLGTSYDESTWVLTSYLVSNAIVLPLSGYLVALMGRKHFFLLCITLFTASSFFCGLAPTLGLLLLFRILQGAFGGGLQPMAQSILADSFPVKQRGLAFALFGVTVVCGPAIGPVLGGWLTDNYSWRWIFYINVPVGILAFLLVQQLVEDPPFLKRFKRGAVPFDYIGFSLLALGVGALQIALDKGQEDDWFGSTYITFLLIAAAVGLVSLVIWEWSHKHPIVDVRLFKRFDFAASNIMFFFVGVVLMSSTVLMPQFLQTFMGYQAETAGMVLSISAVLLIFLLAIVGKLTARIQARYLAAIGWLGLAAGLYISAQWVNLGVSFGSASLVRIYQFTPVGFLFIPITLAAYVGLSAEQTNAAAGLMNFMRNIGQSVGTSIVTTVLAQRVQYHQAVLSEFTSSSGFNDSAQALAGSLARAGMSFYDAQQQALGRLYGMVQAQAAALSYVDVYWVLGVASALMFMGSFALKANKPGEGGNVSVH